jgi:hypothetical protein
VDDDLGEDPDPWLVIGPDRAGNLLEIVVLNDQIAARAEQDRVTTSDVIREPLRRYLQAS